MYMKKNIIITLVILFFPILVFAHQPRLITDKDSIEIIEPEISKAYYGELKGAPDVYKIESDIDFKLYVGILVPDIENIGKDVSAYIYKLNNNLEKEILSYLDGENFKWENYFEEHAGDDYFWGPEFKSERSTQTFLEGKEVEAGSYTIEVLSPDNQGKYTLAIGEKEKFPPSEIINATKLLPKLKKIFLKNLPLQHTLINQEFIYLLELYSY